MFRSRPFRGALLIALAACLPVPARAATFQWHGLLDVVAAERTDALKYNVFKEGDSPFGAYRLRLFADATVNDHVQVLTQFILNDAVAPYVDGAYAIYTPVLSRDIHVMAGKLPWAIGTYGPRTYSNKNPLITPPLMYEHHTSLVWYKFVPTTDVMLKAAGTGSTGVNYFGYAMSLGMPIVDDSFWDVGASLVGSVRPLEFAIGMNAGTPGWGSTTQDENSGKSVLGRVGMQALPWLRFGVSGAYGPYLVSALDPTLPAGKSANDFHQKLAMADVEVLAGHAEFHAEGARNAWETPAIGNLWVSSGYAELKYSIPAGFYLAGRYDVERFSEIVNSTGESKPWDWNARRIEAGVGYRFSRDARAKLVHQRTTFEGANADGSSKTLPMLAAQLSFGF